MSYNDPNAPRPPSPGPYRPGPPAYRSPPHSGLAIAAFVVGLVGFIAGFIPFLGIVGTVGLVLGIVDLRRPDSPEHPRRHGLATAGVVLGALATVGAGLWGFGFFVLSHMSSHGSCPHVYSFDGERYRLDADMVSGALYAGAERDDFDRLESVRESSGAYRVRLVNELQEIDHVNRFALLAVDAPSDLEVLPTPRGDLVGVRNAQPPTRATDAAGRDVLAVLTANDGRTVTRSAAPTRASNGDPRETWTLEFARPRAQRGMLIVRGHSTPFAERAFVAYMASMGQGIRPLIEWRQQHECECHSDFLAEETARLGLPLSITVSSHGARDYRTVLGPVGPAIARSQAIPVELAGDGERVTVQLFTTPRFWEIDQVQLAGDDAVALTPRVLAPRTALRMNGDDVAPALAADDGARLVLRSGEHADVTFDAPAPVPGATRTVVARMRGYYEMDIGGAKGVNAARMLAHQFGYASLPRFASGLADERDGAR